MPYLDIYNYALAGRRLRIVESNISILFIWYWYCEMVVSLSRIQSPVSTPLRSAIHTLHNVRWLVRCKPKERRRQ